MTVLRRRTTVLILLVSGWCLGPAVVRAQSGRHWLPEDRVLLSAFHQVGAVATGIRRVFAASRYGLEVYDFAAGRWEPPLTVEDGYPAGEQPTALHHDPFQDVVYLGTADGALYAYRGGLRRWERYGLVADGPILSIVTVRDAMDGALYLAVPGGWRRLGLGSLAADHVPPGELPREVRRQAGSAVGRLSRADPFFDALRGTLALDERLRRWPITDVAPGDLPGQYWLATDGGNLLRYDSRAMSAERFRFGLLSRGAGAVALDGGTLWFAGDGRGPRRGVSRADTALQEWRYYEAGIDGAPAGHVAAVLPTSDAVWFAATDGLFRYDRRQDTWHRLTGRDGLPGDDAEALAPAAGGLWVGSTRGLAFLTADSRVIPVRPLAGRRINGLVLSRDTLWIASDAGLWMIPAGGRLGEERDGVTGDVARLTPAPGTREHPAMRGRVVAVLPAFGAVLTLTEDALYRYDGEAWSGPIREPSAGGLGRLRTMYAADGQLWVSGDGGVARWDARFDPTMRLWTFHLARQDIPVGPVWNVVPAGDQVWLATPAGALRLNWRR